MERYSLRKRIFIFKAYIKYRKSCGRTRQAFRRKYPGRPVPSRQTILRLAQKFNETGCVTDRKRNRRRHVLTEAKLDEVRAAFQRSPRKSLRRTAQQSGISVSSARRATKLLKLKPYIISTVHQLNPLDHNKRLNFCNWILDNVHNGNIDHRLILFSDEAWFHLNGHVASRNNRYWASEKPEIVNEIPLHDEKVGVWCAISSKRIIGPFFYQGTINSERYIRNILEPLCDELTYEERLTAYFQQDNATAHTAHQSMTELRRIFGPRIISRGLWPPFSPDLSVCDFYLWGTLKNRVYATNPHTLQELKTNIRREIRSISGEELLRVNDSFLRRCEFCVIVNGQHFQQQL